VASAAALKPAGRGSDVVFEFRRWRVAGRPRARYIGVLVLTNFEDDDSGFAAMRVGARGYLVKGAEGRGPARISSSLQSRGDLSPSIGQRPMGLFPAARSAAPLFPELTDQDTREAGADRPEMGLWRMASGSSCRVDAEQWE
jgi:DNA-binding NarL/FixJ family response regulator